MVSAWPLRGPILLYLIWGYDSSLDMPKGATNDKKKCDFRLNEKSNPEEEGAQGMAQSLHRGSMLC